jgi:glycosyltransferase involved in cell wall biosynthesis
MLVHVPIAIDIESFGLVYMEALAFGVPSIFTLSGILNEIPQVEKYAQIVPYMDSEAIYLAMIKFASNSLSSMDRFPLHLMSQFGIEEMADLYFDEICTDLGSL